MRDAAFALADKVRVVREFGPRPAVVGIRTRLAGHHRPLDARLLTPLDGQDALEIGGPTDRFGTHGVFPVYSKLRSCDCVQWRSDTAWHSLDEEMPFAPEGEPVGRLILAEGDSLTGLDNATWGAVISCHVIEHFANPLRALYAWHRVLRPGGLLLIVAPHFAATFDHRREPTALEHMVRDYERGVGEDDDTHIEETIALHDRRRDPVRMDNRAWTEQRRDNVNTRVVHHHVFYGGNLAALVDAAGFRLHWVRARWPHDVVLLAEKPTTPEAPDNSAVLAGDSAWRRSSPFAVDRRRR